LKSQYAASLKDEEARTILSAGIIMGTIFGDTNGCIQVDFLYIQELINAVHY
jgi:hypothetical protein